MTPTYLKDWTERVAWTAAEAATGVVIVELGGLSWAWAPVFATALAALKGVIARRIGDRESAATLPEPPPFTAPPIEGDPT